MKEKSNNCRVVLWVCASCIPWFLWSRKPHPCSRSRVNDEVPDWISLHPCTTLIKPLDRDWGTCVFCRYFRQAKSLVGLNRCSSQPDVCSRTLQRQPAAAAGLTDWQLKYTGIPVVLLDMGATKSRTQRRIQLILAERGTGFTLWRDTIDNLSNYEVAF